MCSALMEQGLVTFHKFLGCFLDYPISRAGIAICDMVHFIAQRLWQTYAEANHIRFLAVCARFT